MHCALCRSYGGANFWIMFMFGGLVICFVISYIVHLVHVSLDLGKMIVFNFIAVCLLVEKDNLCQVMKLVRLRQQGLDDDFEGKTYTRVRRSS